MTFSIQPADRLATLPEQFFAALAIKANTRIALGRDVINLGQGNPDLPTPPHIVEALQDAAANPAYHKYPPFRGYPFLKEAVAKRYSEDYGVTLDPAKEVAILFGGKTGLVEISQCLLNPGDVCLVPDPGYPDYWSGVALAEAEMAFMPLKRDNAFLPDYGQLDSDTLRRAKLMFLNYPNNPRPPRQPQHFMRRRSRLPDGMASSSPAILLTARSAMMVAGQSASWRRLVPRKSAWSSTPPPKRTTWQDGASDSRSAMRKSSRCST